MLNGNSPPFVTDYLSVWPGDEMRTGGGLSLKEGGGLRSFPPGPVVSQQEREWYPKSKRKPNAVMTQPWRKEREEHTMVEEHLINDMPRSHLSLVRAPPPFCALIELQSHSLNR